MTFEDGGGGVLEGRIEEDTLRGGVRPQGEGHPIPEGGTGPGTTNFFLNKCS